MNVRPSPAEAASWRRLRVLLVDDVEPMRMVLRALLRQMGVTQCEEAADGDSALQALQSQPVDLVLCDWRMPGLDGLGLWMAMQDDERLRHIPFVLISAENDPEALAQARDAGITGLLLKPFDAAILADAIRQALRERAPTVTELPDLRSPLASAFGLLEPLLQDDSLAPAQRESLQGVEQALLEAIDSLQLAVELPRLELGRSELRTRGVPLRKLLERSKRLLLLSQAHRRLSLELDVPGPLRGPQALMASGDALLSHTMLQRLLEAAVALLPDGSRLRLNLQADGDQLRLTLVLPLLLSAAQRAAFFAPGSAAQSARRLAQAQRGELVLQVDEAAGHSLLVLQLLRSQLTVASG